MSFSGLLGRGCGLSFSLERGGRCTTVVKIWNGMISNWLCCVFCLTSFFDFFIHFHFLLYKKRVYKLRGFKKRERVKATM